MKNKNSPFLNVDMIDFVIWFVIDLFFRHDGIATVQMSVICM